MLNFAVSVRLQLSQCIPSTFINHCHFAHKFLHPFHCVFVCRFFCINHTTVLRTDSISNTSQQACQTNGVSGMPPSTGVCIFVLRKLTPCGYTFPYTFHVPIHFAPAPPKSSSPRSHSNPPAACQGGTYKPAHFSSCFSEGQSAHPTEAGTCSSPGCFPRMSCQYHFLKLSNRA